MAERGDETLIQVRLTDGPIRSPHPFPPEGLQTAGAVLMFRGIVRPHEKHSEATDLIEDPIEGLRYQVYQPMTTRELARLASIQAREHGVLAVDVHHSEGFVAAGECSFILQVAGKHRGEAIRFMDEFIIEMKRHVPIWKIPHWRVKPK